MRYYKNIPQIQNDINCHKILNKANPMNIQNHEKQRQIQNVPVYCFLHKIFHNETFINSGYRDITKNIPEIQNDIYCHKTLNTAKSNEYLQS